MSIRIYGNRELKTLPGLETRPTSARVRQALFNIWQGSILDCRWLDLCTGSGAMGAEALCRGAKSAIGIERSMAACSIIEQNWTKVAGEFQEFHVWRGDVVKRLADLDGQKFDRIYFDPPYAGKIYQLVLEAIDRSELLAIGGELAVEHSPDPNICGLPTALSKLELCRSKNYGNTAISFYQLRKISG
ncbi:16S rRNA (guanine(966)-N(2))-methyltransferase RsmD [Chamaesiphon sp. VAR_48_metabat_135_sub]|uniref:16S rRNA (guanine(966)-N(2))-methyltransferase RsmD n=1 Tax=Chamaesiphon sp. VAR_48_metabat_135_sub TaxID=2964699 RepID=UPI00286CF02E|nr:16S rRNA (guanine(966)-N(2))-methyltransferase RsmD [Chamaesiphon sp. VAR_48_metabat_135_sub]